MAPHSQITSYTIVWVIEIMTMHQIGLVMGGDTSCFRGIENT